MTPADKATISSEIEERVQDYVDALKAKDIERVLAFCSDSPRFVHAGDGEIFGGHAKWSALIRDTIEQIDHVLYWNNDDIHIEPLALDAAVYTMNFEAAWVKKDGEKVEFTGSWTYVFQKFGSEWQIIHSNGAHKSLQY